MNFPTLSSFWSNNRSGSAPVDDVTDATATARTPLARIPVEYQETFRQTILQEMGDNKQDQTDKDMLLYLRQRRQAFQNGQYIDPNGRLGQLPLSRQELHAQGVTRPQTGAGTAEQAREKRKLESKK